MNDDHIKKVFKEFETWISFLDEFENVRVDFDIFRYMEPIFHIDNNFQFSEQRIIEKSGYVQERFFMKKINFEITITLINSLLSRKCPETFNSSWILKHAPACYYFIRKNHYCPGIWSNKFSWLHDIGFSVL